MAGENREESLRLPEHELLYITAAGNYAEVVWKKAGKIHKTLLCSSLSRLEEQSEGVDALQRCHRSYLINLQQVEKVSGNAQGYLLHLKGTALTIPASRTYAPKILKKVST